MFDSFRPSKKPTVRGSITHPIRDIPSDAFLFSTGFLHFTLCEQ